ncbi:hypothetical protein MMRN_42260 [Mycobacterium marinum]|nr:hypothetical protein MMRN_42260 [Mycobacterium marinum]GJO50140.1 hypothetical protein NJB1604_35550 [Mycobacterium marinum]
MSEAIPPTADVNQLRQELVRRLRAYPPSLWSAQLLAVVAILIDLQFGDSLRSGGIDVASRPQRLRVVR